MIVKNCYYGTADYQRQRDFILSHTVTKPSVANQKKTKSVQFILPLGGNNKRVCKQMFLKTLNISDKLLYYTLNKAQRNRGMSSDFSGRDERGRHSPHNKSSTELLDSVRRHIESFPVMDPHYCRQQTKRRFLGADLNITKMLFLYVEDCVTSVTRTVDRRHSGLTSCTLIDRMIGHSYCPRRITG